MTLRQMEYFLAVAEEGSFSRAAAQLHVTQPALSQQLLVLERDLGAPLVERMGRGVRMTAAGRAYLPHVHATLASERRGRRAVTSVLEGLSGELELAAVMSVAVGVLLKPILRWHQEVPNISVRLSEFSHRRTLESFIAEGSADLGIGPEPAFWQGHAVPLGIERFVLVLPTNDPALQHLRPYTGGPPAAAPRSLGTMPLAALQDRQWVLFERTNGLSELIERHLLGAGLSPGASLRTDQFVTAATLAASGMGPTLVPANIVPADLDAAVCEPDPPLLRSLAAYSRTPLDGVAQRFVELLLDTETMLEGTAEG